MIFWDSSAVVPLLIREIKSAEAQSVLKENRNMLVWTLTSLECTSALERRKRSGELHMGHFRAAEERLKRLKAAWDQIQLTDKLTALASRLLRTHPLRAADSMQLAAALVAGQHDPSKIRFYSHDTRLNEAAEKEGLAILHLHPI